MGYRPELRIHETLVTTYERGPDRPKNWTGARIRGALLAGMVEIPFEIRVGKGMAQARKGLRLVDVDGRLWRSVSLDGTSEGPHYLMIRELLPANQPNLVLSLLQVVDICHECEEAADLAREEAGQNP